MNEKVERNLRWVKLAKTKKGGKLPTMREMATNEGVHFTTLQKVLRRYGIKRR